MENKIEIVYEHGKYTWRVISVRGELLGSGCADTVMQAAGAAVWWMGGIV